MSFKKEQFDALFNPETIVIVGASDNKNKFGYFVLDSLQKSGYNGKIIGINPRMKGKEVLGVPILKKIEDIPYKADLAIFAVPAAAVLTTLKESATKGISGGVIFGGGFKEAGTEGAVLENEVAAVAKKFNVPIVGPNCIGMLNMKIGMNATFLPGLSKVGAGQVAIVSQSGGIASSYIYRCIDAGVGIGKVVGVGNSMNIDFANLMPYLLNDDNTDVICLFMEGFANARTLYDYIRKYGLKKPVLVLKTGHGKVSSKAALSHTGSIAGSKEIYSAAFRQLGIVQVDGLQTMVNATKAFTAFKSMGSGGIGILTHTAGPGIFTSEILESLGVEITTLSDETVEQLSAIVPSVAPKPSNPLDLTGAGNFDFDMYHTALDILLNDQNVAAAGCIFTHPLQEGFVYPAEVAGRVVKKHKKPTVYYFMAPHSIDLPERKQFESAGIPVYDTPEEMGRILVTMVRDRDLRDMANRNATKNLQSEKLPYKGQEFIKNISVENKFLNEIRSKDLIRLYDLKTTTYELANNEEQAAEIAEVIGFPVVMKIVSPQIVHKTDAGGVSLNIKNSTEAKKAFLKIIESAQSYNPHALIEGVCVQKMAPQGLEVIIGAKRDQQWGPVVMFGLGGTMVEILKDVSYRISPVTCDEAKIMMSEIKAAQMLYGYRGSKGIDRNSLAEAICNVSKIIYDNDWIEEIDLNPVIAYENGLLVVDARVICSITDKKVV